MVKFWPIKGKDIKESVEVAVYCHQSPSISDEVQFEKPTAYLPTRVEREGGEGGLFILVEREGQPEITF